VKQCLFAVYAISCLVNQCRYIGGTARIDKRPNEHWAALASGNHYNKNLQADYNKYSANSMVFVILEWVSDEKSLLEREQQAVAQARLAGVCYNIKDVTPNSRGHKLSEETRQKQSDAKRGKKKPAGFGIKIANLIKKSYRFVSPAGEIVEVKGLKAFCDEQGLNAGDMSGVARGRLRQYKGWRRG
jgi:group I intron endonuclease